MEELCTKIKDTTVHAGEYVRNHLYLIKLSIAERISKTLSNVIAFCVALFFLLFFLLFVSIAAAHAIGDWTGHLYLGFLVVGFVYLFAALFAWSYRSKIRFRILNAMMRQLSNHENEN